MGEALITVDELGELENTVAAALATQDTSSLDMLGFGEVSVALGWPAGEPTVVCKRTPPFTPTQFADYERLVTEYVAKLRAAGLDVVDTSVMALDRDGRKIAYLVQPKLPSGTLGQNVLAAAEPDAEHPLLIAIGEAIGVVGPTLSIDAQVTNFSWSGSRATLIDVGTPFLWDENGQLRFEMKPFTRMIPAPTRSIVVRDLTKLVDRWRDPRRVAIDVVANLYREGLTTWVEPTLAAFNRLLAATEPMTAEEGKAFYDEDVKTWPRLKRLQAIERWWQSSIRRKGYDFFIHTTYDP